MHYSAYLFDLDGTLIDSADCAVEATRRAFQEHGLPEVNGERVRAMMGIPIERFFSELAQDYSGDWSEVYATFRAHYAEFSKNLLRVFPGVRELLEELSGAQKRVSIVTSKKSTMALLNCERLGIASFINHIIGSDSVTHYKPHPDGVHRSLSQFGITNRLHEVLVIGDARVDIEMGQSAGVATCAALWGAHAPEELLELNPTHTAAAPLELLNVKPISPDGRSGVF